MSKVSSSVLFVASLVLSFPLVACSGADANTDSSSDAVIAAQATVETSAGPVLITGIAGVLAATVHGVTEFPASLATTNDYFAAAHEAALKFEPRATEAFVSGSVVIVNGIEQLRFTIAYVY
jgi:hypothetical protein